MGNYLVIASYAFIMFVFGRVYGAFKVDTMPRMELVYSNCLMLLITNVIVYFQLCLIARTMLNPLWQLACMVVQLLGVSLLILLVKKLYFLLFPLRDIIAVCGDITAEAQFFSRVSARLEKYMVREVVNADVGLQQIFDRILPYSSVMVCDVQRSLLDPLMRFCYAHGKRVYLLPTVPDLLTNRASTIQMFDTPVLLFKNKAIGPEQAIIKRAMDIIISLILLVIFSPFMLVIALCIKLTDGGPVFFYQQRVTKDGKLFRLVKFRSMVVDAERDGAQKSSTGDDRITPIGKIIRPTRLDETPQLFNILQGSMSLVGPRPERVENVEEYSAILPDFTLRLKVKAGLTGYAQLYGKYNTSPRDKLNMDLLYINRYSILRDIQLLLMTPKVMFMRESTEGFDPSVNQKTQTGEQPPAAQPEQTEPNDQAAQTDDQP